MENKEFCYLGFHFLPVGTLPDLEPETEKIWPFLKSDFSLGFSTYGWQKYPYSWEGFYAACGERESDLFYCRETGRLYIPCQNELFRYMPYPETPFFKREITLRQDDGMDKLEVRLMFERRIFILMERVLTRMNKMFAKQDNIPVAFLKVRSAAFKRLIQLLMGVQENGTSATIVEKRCNQAMDDIDIAINSDETDLVFQNLCLISVKGGEV